MPDIRLLYIDYQLFKVLHLASSISLKEIKIK